MATNFHKKPVKKVIDFSSSLDRLMNLSEATANDKFATAARVAESGATAVSTAQTEPPVERDFNSVSGSRSDSNNPLQYGIGGTYSVPLSLIDLNPWGARYFYVEAAVEVIVKAFEGDGPKQDVACNGFVTEQGRVQLVDGGTRYRAARATGKPTLDVKIEEPLLHPIDLYNRSAKLNNQRTSECHLDTAFLFTKFLKDGTCRTHEEIISKIKKPDGSEYLPSQISAYVKIGRIPEHFLQMMRRKEQTSMFTIAGFIADIFAQPDYEQREEFYTTLASDVIEHIGSKKLSKEQSRSFIDAKLNPVQSRTRETPKALDLQFDGKPISLKLFPKRGEVQLVATGLDESQVNLLKDRLQAAFASPIDID